MQSKISNYITKIKINSDGILNELKGLNYTYVDFHLAGIEYSNVFDTLMFNSLPSPMRVLISAINQVLNEKNLCDTIQPRQISDRLQGDSIVKTEQKVHLMSIFGESLNKLRKAIDFFRVMLKKKHESHVSSSSSRSSSSSSSSSSSKIRRRSRSRNKRRNRSRSSNKSYSVHKKITEKYIRLNNEIDKVSATVFFLELKSLHS